MANLTDEIKKFLSENGYSHSSSTFKGMEGIIVSSPLMASPRIILPIEIHATDSIMADEQHRKVTEAIDSITPETGYPLIVAEDRWHRQQQMTKARLLAHIETFASIYARNCTIKRIDKKTAGEFLDRCHSYGDASCRYRYGMYLDRHTGHLADKTSSCPAQAGDLVAVAEFSNARRWIKADKEIRSYEWTRYASLPGLRICGGMGKMLDAFIAEVHPDDIMSYADLEWSEGKVYEQLGFTMEGLKSPVLFGIDGNWMRKPHAGCSAPQLRFFKNFGSRKYRLKLTDYQ